MHTLEGLIAAACHSGTVTAVSPCMSLKPSLQLPQERIGAPVQALVVLTMTLILQVEQPGLPGIVHHLRWGDGVLGGYHHGRAQRAT